MYSCHIFLISSASIMYLIFVSLIMPGLARNVPLISLIYLKRSLVLLFYCLPLFLCIVHLRRLYYLSMLFSGTHSIEHVSIFLPCLLLPFFSQLFVKLPETITLPSCFSFFLGWFWSLPLVHVTNLCT